VGNEQSNYGRHTQWRIQGRQWAPVAFRPYDAPGHIRPARMSAGKLAVKLNRRRQVKLVVIKRLIIAS
jgi:hypothetical protein